MFILFQESECSIIALCSCEDELKDLQLILENDHRGSEISESLLSSLENITNPSYCALFRLLRSNRWDSRDSDVNTSIGLSLSNYSSFSIERNERNIQSVEDKSTSDRKRTIQFNEETECCSILVMSNHSDKVAILVPDAFLFYHMYKNYQQSEQVIYYSPSCLIKVLVTTGSHCGGSICECFQLLVGVMVVLMVLYFHQAVS